MHLHEAVAQALVDHGVRVVFGVLGDGNLYVIDSFRRQPGAKYVSMCTEAGAVLAANGYARTSGSIGVASVTHGPGLTNTVTALVEGVRDRAPIVVIAGDTPILDRESLQDIAQREVVQATGAGFEMVRSPDTAIEDVASAIRRARVERRPIVLNLPRQFQWLDVAYSPVQSSAVAPQAVIADPTALELAAGLVANSVRPIVLAGRGAASRDAKTALVKLAARIGAPLATTLRGKDLFFGEASNLGIFGTFSDEAAVDVITKADCILAFGAGLNRWTTAEGSLLKGKRVIQVDSDLEAINRFTNVTLGLQGDCAATANSIVELLDLVGVAPTKFAPNSDLVRGRERVEEVFDDKATDGYVDLHSALTLIDRSFPRTRTFVTDNGRFIFRALAMIHVPDPTAYVHTLNFGSIGLGMGQAVGAYLGAPERPVLLVCGDGGFMLGGLSEFSSAVRHKVRVAVVVLNDGAYGAEHVQLRDRGMDPSVSTFDWPDLGPVAEALGGVGLTARSLDELEWALDTAASVDGPTLIDVKVDPEKVGVGSH